MRNYLLLLLIICFSNCNNNIPYNNCINLTDTVIPLKIQLTDTLYLFLDSLMVMEINTPIDYHETTHQLYTFDNYNKRILTYSLAKNKVIYPKDVQSVDVKQKISFFRYTTADSLILYAYAGATLFHYKRKTSFISASTPHGSSPPHSSEAAPLYFSGDTIIGSGYLVGESNRENHAARTILSIILPDGKTIHRIPYPQSYKEHNWGGAHMRAVYTTRHQQQIVISLPADHHVQVINSNFQMRAILAATRKKICISSMTLSKDDKRLSDSEYALSYWLNTPSYRNIIYDQYHHRYYRILELPTDGFKGKEINLIAFDENFNYLGETVLPSSLALDNYFITEDGIYFFTPQQKDQNIARYVQCKIEI